MAGWLPPGKQTFVDLNGAPLVDGLLHHYIPGTSSRKDTWQDYDQNTLNTNPIVLDERGQAIIYGNGNYRQVLQDADGNEIWDRNVSASVGSNSLAAGAIFGLTMGNNTASPTAQIDVSVGQARDSTNTVDIVLEAPITKSITAVWAAGTVQGMRDSATALAASQSYSIYVIMNPTTQAVDVLASQSATNPTLPTGYVYFRRIGSIPRLGADNIPPSGTNIPGFTQWGNLFQLTSPNNEWTAQSGSTSPLLRAVLTPLGVKTLPLFFAQMNISPVVPGVLFRVTDPDLGVPPAFGGGNQFGQMRMGTAETYLTATFQDEPTNTLAQVYVQLNNATVIWALKTLGWIDFRGLYG